MKVQCFEIYEGRFFCYGIPALNFIYLFIYGHCMQWLRNLFGFTRAQTNGFAVLLPLLLLIIFSEPLYRNFFLSPDQPPEIIFPSGNPAVPLPDLDGIAHTADAASSIAKVNPNDASFNEWVSLHVPQEVAARILAYRKKGGKFLYKTDLLKIYGLDTALYERLAIHLNLPDQPENFSVAAAPARLPAAPFDLNFADSAQLVSVYGIGPVLARRIMNYRHALGGFVAWHQLYRVYGLDTAVIIAMQKRFIIKEDFIPRKININTATEQELAAHPLISVFMARAIFRYRLQHGNFSRVEDVLKIIPINVQDFESVKPYLTVE